MQYIKELFFRHKPNVNVKRLVICYNITRHACLLGIVLCSLALTQAVCAQEPVVKKQSLKILGIGNSILTNATKMLPDLVSQAGHELVYFRFSPSGRSLHDHYRSAMLGEANPKDPKIMFAMYENQKLTLKELLQAQKWDFVTIQQSPPDSWRINTYRPHARDLHDFIKKYAPQAEVVFHQTWAWKPDFDRMDMDKSPPGFMYQEVTKNYHTIAKEIGISKIIPVADAYQLAEESPEWKFSRDPNFDYENPKYPELPNESNSLHHGFYWVEHAVDDQGVELNQRKRRGPGTGKMTFKNDGVHASPAGSYLAACVWYEFFFGEDVRKLTENPPELGDRAASLREIAHKVVSEGVRPAAWPTEIE